MLKVVSYNIHSGRNLFGRRRLSEMTEVLRHLDADIIGLQEVHQNSRYGYQASHIATELQYHLEYSPSIKIADGWYGNALLTRLPLIRSTTQTFPAKREMRSLLQSVLVWEGAEIDAWVTHFSLNQRCRDRQLNLIHQEVKQHTQRPLIIMGDLNATNVSLLPLLQDCAVATGRHKLPTLPSFLKRVDYIFASTHWLVTDYQLLNVRWSDHFPLLTRLERTLRPTPAK